MNKSEWDFVKSWQTNNRANFDRINSDTDYVAVKLFEYSLDGQLS